MFSPQNASFLEDFTVFPLNLYSSSIFVRKVLFFYIFTINNFFSFKNFSSFLSKILITHFEWNEKYLTKFCYKVLYLQKEPTKVFCKKVALKYFAIFTERHVSESLFNKLAVQKACNLIKKRLQHRCFLMNIAKYLRTACFTEHPGFCICSNLW